MTSASETLATVIPAAPASTCSLAMPGTLCVFTCGLRATRFSEATSAILRMFLSIFRPSIKTYGVPPETFPTLLLTIHIPYQETNMELGIWKRELTADSESVRIFAPSGCELTPDPPLFPLLQPVIAAKAGIHG